MKLYSQRPSIKETYNVFRDVLKRVATVNILSYTERFTQKLMSSVPILDKTTDDIIQGTNAGILITAVGKATIQRCRVYQGWNIDEQVENFRKTSREFLLYVKDIISLDDVKLLEKEGADFCVTRSPCPPIPRIISRQFSGDILSAATSVLNVSCQPVLVANEIVKMKMADIFIRCIIIP